jgi:hypothetical protein
MARLGGIASYQTIRPSEVDPGAPTSTRTLKRIIENLAHVYDLVTGSNGKAGVVVNHAGTAGRGARLGMPWVNMAFAGRDARVGQFGVDLSYTNATVGAKGKGSFGNDTMIVAVPIYITPAESSFTAKIIGNGLNIWTWRMRITDENFTTLYEREFTCEMGGLILTIEENDATLVPSGNQRYVIIFADTTERQIASGTTPDAQVRMYSCTLSPTRIRDGGRSPVRRATTDFQITAPGAGVAIAWQDFDSTLLTDDNHGHAYLLARANRNRNALYEYITGWPAGGNAAYTLADTASSNPGTSRFLAYTNSVFATEGNPPFPVLAEAFGAFMLDGNAVVADGAGGVYPPSAGMLDWYGLIPVATAASILRQWRCYIPDFPNAAPGPKLAGLILAGTNNSVEGIKWSGGWTIGGVASALNLFAVVPGTNNKLMVCKHFNLQFSPDVMQTISLRSSKGVAKVAEDEIIILGASLFFLP